MKAIMTRAWEIAKNAVRKYGHNVKDYFRMALRMAWQEAKAAAQIKPVSERIEELEQCGFKRWIKGNLDRLYINAAQLGLVCTYYKSGNISNAYFQGYSISNCEARRMKAAKTFIDVKTGIVYSDNVMLKKAAKELARISN